MSPLETAFFEADFNWVAPLQGVWRDEAAHVDATDHVADRIMREFAPLQAPGARTLIGQVVNGPAGSGKTHLLGALRRRAWEAGASFVLIDLVGVTDFWRTALLGFIRSLRQTTPNGQSQYQTVFLSALRRVPEGKKREVMQSREGSGAVRTINAFVRALQSTYPDEALEHSNVVRALLLQNDPDAAEIAYSWLLGLDVEAEDRRTLGLTSPPPPPNQLVRGVSWLMSLAGPTMIAIDQINSIVTAGNILMDRPAELDDETEARARAIIQILGGGLMDLYDQTFRSMTVVTCLIESWEILRKKALASATNRFAAPLPLELGAMGRGCGQSADRPSPRAGFLTLRRGTALSDLAFQPRRDLRNQRLLAPPHTDVLRGLPAQMARVGSCARLRVLSGSRGAFSGRPRPDRKFRKRSPRSEHRRACRR